MGLQQVAPAFCSLQETPQEENVPRSRGEEANRAKSRDEGEILELRLDLRHELMYHSILKAELDA